MSETGTVNTPTSPPERRQLVKFLVVGLSNTALSFAVFMAANRWLPEFDGRAGASQVLSYGAGILWSFMLNGGWVFNGHSGSSAFARFLIVQLALLAATSLLIEAANQLLPGWHVASWFAVMAVSTVANYFLMRIWVFPPAIRHT